MTDEPLPDNPAPLPPAPPSGNGRAGNGRANGRPTDGRAAVRSGLAQRRNPVLANLGAFAAHRPPGGLPRPRRAVPAARLDRPRDRVRHAARRHQAEQRRAWRCRSARCRRSPGTARPHQRAAARPRQPRRARHDRRRSAALARGSRPSSTTRTVRTPVTVKGTKRIRVSTVLVPAPGAGLRQPLWAAYPPPARRPSSSLHELDASGAMVAVDQQSGKGTKTIVVQFLIPILLLVCLFSLFMRLGAEGAAGGIAGFSQFAGKGRKQGKGTSRPHHVRRRRRRRRSGGRAARDPRLPRRTAAST